MSFELFLKNAVKSSLRVYEEWLRILNCDISVNRKRVPNSRSTHVPTVKGQISRRSWKFKVDEGARGSRRAIRKTMAWMVYWDKSSGVIINSLLTTSIIYKTWDWTWCVFSLSKEVPQLTSRSPRHFIPPCLGPNLGAHPWASPRFIRGSTWDTVAYFFWS